MVDHTVASANENIFTCFSSCIKMRPNHTLTVKLLQHTLTKWENGPPSTLPSFLYLKKRAFNYSPTG
ncbi:hypothetical protein POVWA2_037550 [Plasmodium ovale wallikeri]|uniref:Uncharacterized protein n=1 Tax=Plasmodium ovale wallikeri TaxID=864142 RepID=A0A1A8Z622_PLAOA|nr:hypothetical protein POVWA1_038570 [Plasmodium ovale wallikeri]SBT39313.1 hypothetical protein POVWA2_037550 [Plasmodium ovale wallikeri]